MKRKFNVTPVETLELCFPDGTVREACFNIEALIYLTEEFGDIGKLVSADLTKPYELAAKILYSGMRTFDATVTRDDAKAIVVAGGASLMSEILDMFSASFGEIPEDELKKKLEPEITKMLQIMEGAENFQVAQGAEY